jgi:hypothetical protein
MGLEPAIMIHKRENQTEIEYIMYLKYKVIEALNLIIL